MKRRNEIKNNKFKVAIKKAYNLFDTNTWSVKYRKSFVGWRIYKYIEYKG